MSVIDFPGVHRGDRELIVIQANSLKTSFQNAGDHDNEKLCQAIIEQIVKPEIDPTHFSPMLDVLSDRVK